MNIVVIKETPGEPAVEEFSKVEWKKWDLEHYGEILNYISEHYTLKALEGEEIVGLLAFKVDGGVCFIDELIVKSDQQGKGFGEDLIMKAEEIAREYHCHKAQLHTGADWKERKFYEHMGYKKTNDLPDQYLRRDFVEYTKYIL